MSGAPLFSLVVATRGRRTELARLLESLSAQTELDFEVLFVDQNVEPLLDDVVNRPWPFPVHHVRTPGASGACRARNVGWRRAVGRWVLFPDDDCWYPEGFLAHARGRLASGYDVLTGRAADVEGRSINGRFELKATSVSKELAWTTSIEWVAFFDRKQLERLGGFDEDIGIGASTPWQSCESQDIVLRSIELGGRVFYDPQLFGHHAKLETRRPDLAQIQKGRAYARGMGWVLRKHHASWLTRLYWVARPAMKAFLALLIARPSEARYLREVAIGRLEGARGKLFA